MRGPFPGRPRIFRDPIHGDIRFPRDQFQQLIEALLDTSIFQRLRRIRQNGVMNLVFHGAEHSRFAHSMGAAHVAAQMFDAVVHNTPGEAACEGIPLARAREDTILAALLHDIGHGPFSHTLEEIAAAVGLKFHHEEMTVRILTEDGSEIAAVLRGYDHDLPERLLPFIDKKQRAKVPPKWYHAIVSSQLDADRLDYLQRDAYMAGIRTHTFDLTRLIGALGAKKNEIVVDARARDIVDSYLLALDHMYASAYYHHTNRSASFLITSILRRAFALAQDGEHAWIFPALVRGTNPLWELLRHGRDLPLSCYRTIDDALVWAHLPVWAAGADPTLRALVADLELRRLPKSIAAPTQDVSRSQLESIEARAREHFKQVQPGTDPRYYVGLDIPRRTTYTTGDWAEGYADSIKLVSPDGSAAPLEKDPRSLATVLAARKHYPSIIVPSSMREFVLSLMKEQP